MTGREVIVAFSLVSLGTILSLFAFSLGKHYRTWLGRGYLFMCLTFGVWTFGALAMTVSNTEAARVTWYQVSSFGWAYYPMAVLFFVQQIIGKVSSWRRLAVLAVNGLIGTVIFLTMLLDPMLFVDHFEETFFGWGIIKQAKSPVLFFTLLYLVISAAIAFLQLLFWHNRTKYRQEKLQAKLLIFSGIFALIASAYPDIIMPLSGKAAVDMLPIVSLPWFLALFYAAHRLSILEAAPPVSVQELMFRVRDMVFLLDREGNITQMNTSARTETGFTAPIQGESEEKTLIQQLFPEIHLPRAGDSFSIDTDAYITGGKRIPVQLSVSAYLNRYHEVAGYIVTAYDLRLRLAMEIQTIEQQLADDRMDDHLRLYTATMENLTAGILHFGSDQVIHRGYSQYTGSLLQKASLTGEDFIEIVFGFWSEAEKAQLKALLSDIFVEEQPWKLEALMKLLPKSFLLAGRTVKLHFQLLYIDPRQKRKTMMVTLEPYEEPISLGTMQNEPLLPMLVAIFAERESFFELLQEYENWFYMFRKAWTMNRQNPQEVLCDLFRSVHTFKSSFARFGMKASAAALMAYEERLSTMMKEQVTVTAVDDVLARCDPDCWISNDIDALKRVLGAFYDQSQSVVEVDRNQMESIIQALEQDVEKASLPMEMVKKNANRFRELYALHSKELLQDYDAYIQMICMEKGLPKPIFSVLGSDVLLDTKKYRSFFRTLIHVFNNVVAHAIEKPEERLAAAKPERARIECHVSIRKQTLYIEIADDGRGLDPAKIRQDLLNSRQLGQAAGTMDDEQVLQCIFEPGYSSSKVADSLSGRGIGLFAVSHAVKNLGGQVKVQSEVGLYTRFRFMIPLYGSEGQKI